MRGVRSETFSVGIDIQTDRRSQISAIGGFSSKGVFKKLVTAFFLYFLMWGQAAVAATYNLTISGAHSANIILTAGDPGAQSTVTAVSGTFDGLNVTGLSNICGANNIINIGGNLGHVNYGGITITYGNGSDNVNLFYPTAGGVVSRAQINCGAIDTVTSNFSILSATPVPTVSTWAMFLAAGLLGLSALILLRRSRPIPA